MYQYFSGDFKVINLPKKIWDSHSKLLDRTIFANEKDWKVQLVSYCFDATDLPRFFQPVITEDFKIAANSFGVR